MKSLTQAIYESLDSSYIIKNAEKFDTLKDLFTKAGFSKKRHKELEAACKKAIGDGPYYAVMSDTAKEAYRKISDKANVGYRSGFVDLVNLNKEIKDEADRHYGGKVSIEGRKLDIKNALFRNETLKKLGLTDEMDRELKKMNDLFEQEPITLKRDLYVKTDEGIAVVNVYPAMCIVDNKLITGIQFSTNFYLSKGSKFLYVFSDDSLKNVKK